MRSRTWQLLGASALAIAGLAGCSSGDASSPATAEVTIPGTTDRADTVETDVLPVDDCLPAPADDSDYIRLRVTELGGDTGSMGSRTPSSLEPGTIRVVVEADEDNVEAVDVTVEGAAGTVHTFTAVAAGTSCGADVELAAGEYTTRSGGRKTTFHIGAG